MEEETHSDRIVQALNALTLAILSVRREMAAGPVDPTREHFLRDEESWAKAMEVGARELLEYGTADGPARQTSKPPWGKSSRGQGVVVDMQAG
jgi:hypothetical protein